MAVRRILPQLRDEPEVGKAVESEIFPADKENGRWDIRMDR
jgi:hypothetical protein